MTSLTNDSPRRTMVRAILPALFVTTLLAGSVPGPALAQPGSIRIRVAPGELDAGAISQLRRQIAAAARALCGRDGVAAYSRSAVQRCRENTVAAAERQLAARIGRATRLVAAR